MGWQPLKIYSDSGELVGSLRYIEDAAALMTHQRRGASVRLGYAKWETLYTVGEAPQPSISTIVATMQEAWDRVRVEGERRHALKIRAFRESFRNAPGVLIDGIDSSML